MATLGQFISQINVLIADGFFQCIFEFIELRIAGKIERSRPYITSALAYLTIVLFCKD